MQKQELLYNTIHRLETELETFNREPFNSRRLIKLIRHFGIIPIPDTDVVEADAFYFRDNRIIRYNPHLSEGEKVLALGHELGHYLLGHISPEAPPLYAHILSKDDKEKDAGIIGFLFWLPTVELCKIQQDKQGLYIDEVYKYTKQIGTELHSYNHLELSQARLRIFHAYQRVGKRLSA